MYLVTKRSWLAGADPTAAPDLVRTVAVCFSRASAEAKARALAEAGRDTRHDPLTGSWWMRTVDALHELVVGEGPGSKG